ncbi:alpha/beta fold hydrolase [Cellulomonas composti]|uniref:AB hydrolase-1 domain-containing protein n=1 Tax=Cellulomonas composti TaxID=266130 RepID=A0A511J5X9_9CELL|nr:alpha/beta hydrolase [Cellulomonas composti]GEL93410.1 hypothetical protein CCO02nite_00680 [Cellulomonas composti]
MVHSETAVDGWTERWVVVEGHEMLVRCSDEVEGATPQVHIHGFAISGRSLMPTARLLASRATCYVPDLPGFGRSPGWGYTLGVPALADAVVGLLDALELDKAVLVGNSMGCPISLEVAHREPDRVERVVLCSPAGGVHNQPLVRAVQQLVRDAVRESPRMASVAVPDYLRFGPVNAMQLFAELMRFPSMERLLRITVPTLAIVGTRDPMMPPPWRVRELARLAPDNLTVAVIRDAAHAMNFSHPEELARVVSCWLDGIDITDEVLDEAATAGTPGANGTARRPRVFQVRG